VLYLHKILPSIFLPIGITLLLVGAGLIFRKQILCWAGLAFLYLLSTGIISDKIMSYVEGVGGPSLPQTRFSGGATKVSRREVEEILPAEAVVVLSGMLHDRKDAKLGEWSGAVDRFEAGIELFRAGKAPMLVFTKGQVPWRPEDRPEGEILKDRAVRLGVPIEKILVTDKVGNTEDEAEAVKLLLGRSNLREVKGERRENISNRVAGDALLATSPPQHKTRPQNPELSTEARTDTSMARQRIVLVTSAFHMKRAKLLFERQGFEVEAFPVDFQVPDRQKTSILDFLPQADHLKDSETAMREGIGLLYYTFIKR